MRKLGFRAAFLACAALAACQSFTARESVSEPDPTQIKRQPAAEPPHGIPNDNVHAKAMADSKARLPTPPAEPAAQQEMATASHILIRYQGALRTTPDVTRSKDDARKLAEQVEKKLRGGADWVATANEYTEDPSGKGTGGKLGTFAKGRMVPEFDTQVFSLKPGGLSPVVETGFGFHIIKREN